MATTYAEVVKENLEADVTNNAQHHTTATSQDKYSDNYDAAVYDRVEGSRKIVENIKNMSIDRDIKEQKKARGTNEVTKRSKGVVIFTVALDIALAGLLVGTVYKKPTINKVKLGVGTVGLSLFYGFQWFFYQKHN
ncbi:hypothetical protein RhiirA1_411961 [Rhizophagus irregularis]|uniref:Uncharacterized protein n=5 Tax=Rhizophagus irregularis TaxID=588596 RepID=A0A2N0S9X3_9GLOM|nr:hypothetical protein GLOIN_2v1482974 [Rhizophagus irregularis DAOM 181602=DAOM 197198]EXX65245.1 hypothetical protein RirG_135110 [Rhizophagus irregularis DAOM 197198w]PKC72352.1 hypothetical protein RhiirA1_411961 [Rhizophagus irregularis]POG65642.1 hypothetical protein GLOIN_2v1482974 [Rhizophagus irregularis DAOM 181602=DAOM 197198]UZO26306.1 hypothetical protein OCT59_018544 [Rhizophagus irregularis]CAB4492933.1 unnamed protein product [Rhizophagus irregularis]|eukprot:XP_025172508.1 hypothetical protein GLOIN_2v1482974 [Rhizophagus irregularis DAOM 181602=DAOM 197198]